MASIPDPGPSVPAGKKPLGPFRRAVLRGLGVLMPPLLTIVIFLWVGNTVATYLLDPMQMLARRAIYNYNADIRRPAEIPADQRGDEIATLGSGQQYHRVADGNYVPAEVYLFVQRSAESPARNSRELYYQYIDLYWLPPWFVIPVFLLVFVLILYLLGRFLAAGIGRIFWTQLERGIHRVPLVSNVYGSVKQVTDFLFTEREIEYTRVVAVEYPRKGIWSLAMVTGESLLDIRSAANEPVLSVLVPTSPLPMTGFTITIRRSETLDLNITIDQALQFIVSCGVVVPPQQLNEALAARDRQLSSAERSALMRPTSDGV